ncbi:MAG TPA: GGDEF and EAL domain-containing protein [Candidatus Limnocylindrales bacterium]
MPSGVAAEEQIGAGSIRLVRLRLTLALLAMAILPLAVGAPLLATALDSQRNTEEARVQRDAATAAGTISSALDGLETSLTRAASASAVSGIARGDKNALTRARPVLEPVGSDSADGVVTIEVVSTGGVVLFREVGGKIVASPGQVTGDPLLEATSSAGPGDVIIGDPSTRADGTTLVGMAAPLAGATSDAPPVGMLRIDVSLSTLVGTAGSQLGAGTSLTLTDAKGAQITTVQLPNGAGGNTYPGTAPIPSHPDWHVRLVSPVAFGSPSLPLFALLGLAIVVLLSLVVWMAKQILRPAEQLETSRVRLNDLYQLARVDSLRDMLTGLGNHRAFQEEADRQIDASRRYGAPLAVVTINIDDFKAMNDRLGHEGGDGILARFGELIQGSMRSPDRAFRTGADSFAILLPHTDADGGEIFARRLLGVALEPTRGSAARDGISFSAGISACPALATDRRHLIAQAEAAMASAKRHGRTMVETFDPARHRAPGVLSSVAEASAAVAETVTNKLIRPVFQPIVDLRNGKVIGYEGLVRPLPESGFPDPSAMFIAAERAGRTVELDYACIEAVALGSADLPKDAMITINVSPRTLELPDFSPPVLVRTLHRAGLEPDRVVIEITERETIEEMDRLKRNVAACRSAGFRVAADDVGAGNAGLRLLSQIQFDIVKIDLSLVQDGALFETSLAVVGSLQELARRWGAWVIAEGIETPEQLRVVRQLEISAGQGYLLGRPNSTEDLRKLGVGTVDLGALLGRDNWLQDLARSAPGLGVAQSS